MRGQIHVTSEYGRGTKFFFTAIHGRSTEEEVAAAVKARLTLALSLTLTLTLTRATPTRATAPYTWT